MLYVSVSDCMEFDALPIFENKLSKLRSNWKTFSVENKRTTSLLFCIEEKILRLTHALNQ